MLSARDLTLRRGPQPLFEQVNFTVFRGDKVGVTGANGTGRSSLFAAVLGGLTPDRGDIDLPAAIKVAHVEQEIGVSTRPRSNSCWTAMRSCAACSSRSKLRKGAMPPWCSPSSIRHWRASTA